MFTSRQFEIIEASARACVPDEELSVYNNLAAANSQLDQPFNQQQLAIIAFCAEECYRQGSDAISVLWFVQAWDRAIACKAAGAKLGEQLLDELAIMIEPTKNADGYRRTVVTRKGGVVIGSRPENIARDMGEFEMRIEVFVADGTDGWQPVTAQSLYERFEDIHPRKDGNGRLGKIIYNWLTDTLSDPQFPAEPERFKDKGPDEPESE
jgi:hypothetical protein